MKQKLLLFFWGFAISFLGTLPIGTLNISITSFFAHNNYVGALQFGIAAILVEVLLVRIALSTVAFLKKFSIYFTYFKILTIFMLLLFSGITFYAVFKMQTFGTTLPSTMYNPIATGIILSLLNPLHLPFWLGWSAVLINNNILNKSKNAYNIYVVAIGFGTGLAFTLYGFFGKFLIGLFNSKSYWINGVVGFALLATAIFQIVNLCKNKLVNNIKL